jgi:class I fructose-bisphosphate aldolase
LIVKIDGHISAGKDADMPTHAEFCSLDRAMKAGASAIGMTYYLGSTDTTRDVERIGRMVERAHEYGVPVVLWSYPRGPTVNKTQGDSLYWVHHAVKSAEDFGVDIVKTKPPAAIKKDSFEAYTAWLQDVDKKTKTKGGSRYLDFEARNESDQVDPAKDLTTEQHVRRYKLVIDAAPRTFVIFSGGPKIEGDAKKVLTYQTRVIAEAGGEGAIYGRNLWGVPTDTGLELMEAVHSVLSEPQYRRQLPRSMVG